MEINWLTVSFEIINFVVLVGIAVKFVFRPVRAILDERQAQIVARAEQTEVREAEAAKVRAQYERELAKLDELVAGRVAEALAEARTKAEAIVDEARMNARAELDSAEVELEHARQRTLERFRGEILRLATEAARRIVHELGSAEVGLAFARRAAHALEDAVGKPRLVGPVEVAHSPDLDAERLRGLLHELLGAGLELRLRADEQLIGGVRLDAQGIEVESSAGASLDGWYRELARAA